MVYQLLVKLPGQDYAPCGVGFRDDVQRLRIPFTRFGDVCTGIAQLSHTDAIQLALSEVIS